MRGCWWPILCPMKLSLSIFFTIVIVGDDCALPPPRGIAGRRGLAGMIIVHKVAGAAAAAGLSLALVAVEAKRASEMVGTMGVALSVCTLPSLVTLDRLGPGKMELGLGIHGEPGAAVADLQPVDVVVSHVLNQILSSETNYVPITRGNRVVLMINGLGATPVMELMIASGKAVPKLQLEHGLAVDRVYTGSFMTSLDMAGSHPPPKIPVPVPPSRSTKSDESLGRPLQLSEEGQILEVAIEAAANAVIKIVDSLNEWDSRAGDGDCGSTMYKGAAAILEDLETSFIGFQIGRNFICSSLQEVPLYYDGIGGIRLSLKLSDSSQTPIEIGLDLEKLLQKVILFQVTQGMRFTMFLLGLVL
ncbi:putative 3,4-dihydroxy-2-butanone kinase [Humulus lupulus]|uniref:putative 3,4-dihydroxy-2-butanone kinase n=1 Tax=Humulus lupulus TaxID=3486 RepID=UPI002B400863|nr:putative 3,4-dihydroxy-2-butanone kinase [Humulus lupulus]